SRSRKSVIRGSGKRVSEYPTTRSPSHRNSAAHDARGLLAFCSCPAADAYRLTWRVSAAPGLLPRLYPVETSFTHSASSALNQDVLLAFRSASRLFCSTPAAAFAKPGSLNSTQEPASSSLTRMFTESLSVLTVNSLPARTLVSPLVTTSLPLGVIRVGPGGASGPLIRPPPGAISKVAGRPPPVIPPPPRFMRPISPVHTAAFQVGLTSQLSMRSIPVMVLMTKESGTPVIVP